MLTLTPDACPTDVDARDRTTDIDARGRTADADPFASPMAADSCARPAGTPSPADEKDADPSTSSTKAKLFVSAIRPGGEERTTDILVTVMAGDVDLGDTIITADGRRWTVLSSTHTCKSCSFGDQLQEGDRGALTVAGILALAPGTLVSVAQA